MEFDIGQFIRRNYKILIVVTILLFIVLGMLVVRAFFRALPESGRADLLGTNNKSKFETLIDLLEYYECKYIDANPSRGTTYRYKIEAVIKHKPYDGKTSNEKYYMSLITDIAEFYEYENFIIIDESKDLEVEVICSDNKIEKIIVNGIENYFKKHDEELALRAYKKFELVNMNVEAPILDQLINNNWSKDSAFGSRESRFNDYEIYFEEGIEVRFIQGRVYNIVFKSNYPGTVINGLTPQATMTETRSRIGDPTFMDDNSKIYGYKGSDFYAFFGNNEISIYRNEKLSNTEMERFENMLTQFYKEEIDYTTFMDKLTETWKDYSKYDYSSSSVYISYPLKGFEIKVNYDNTRGFIFYNNFNMPESKIENYLDNLDFMALLQLDCVYEAEKLRVKEIEDIYNSKEKLGEQFLDSSNYDISLVKDENGNIMKVRFLAVDGVRPNRELNDSITSFAWVSDDYFVFGKRGNGLFGLNLNTGYVSTLSLGTGIFNITESSDGRIVCDNKEYNIDL